MESAEKASSAYCPKPIKKNGYNMNLYPNANHIKLQSIPHMIMIHVVTLDLFMSVF